MESEAPTQNIDRGLGRQLAVHGHHVLYGEAASALLTYEDKDRLPVRVLLEGGFEVSPTLEAGGCSDVESRGPGRLPNLHSLVCRWDQ